MICTFLMPWLSLWSRSFEVSQQSVSWTLNVITHSSRTSRFLVEVCVNTLSTQSDAAVCTTCQQSTLISPSIQPPHTHLDHSLPATAPAPNATWKFCGCPRRTLWLLGPLPRPANFSSARAISARSLNLSSAGAAAAAAAAMAAALPSACLRFPPPTVGAKRPCHGVAASKQASL
jgi:hypothetical protein